MSYEAIMNFYLARLNSGKLSPKVALKLGAELRDFLSLEGCFAPNVPRYSERRPNLTQ